MRQGEGENDGGGDAYAAGKQERAVAVPTHFSVMLWEILLER